MNYLMKGSNVNEINNAAPAESSVPRLPARFWTAIDFGLMTIEQAVAEWSKQQAQGAEFDALG